MKSESKWEAIAPTGEIPPPGIFAHTITSISKNKLVLFGGCLYISGKYITVNDSYLLNPFRNEWIKLKRIRIYNISPRCNTVTKSISRGYCSRGIADGYLRRH